MFDVYDINNNLLDQHYKYNKLKKFHRCKPLRFLTLKVPTVKIVK